MHRLKVRAIIEHEGRFLLVRNASSRQFWCLPGGSVETGEELQRALKRELVEETGVEPEIGALGYIHQLHIQTSAPVLEFFFWIRNSGDYAALDLEQIKQGSELQDIDWLKMRPSEYILPEFLAAELPELSANTGETSPRIRTS